MHELQRHQYLNALGIDSYMPRVLLGYAPAPRACELPVFDDNQIETRPATTALVTPAQPDSEVDVSSTGAAAPTDIAATLNNALKSLDNDRPRRNIEQISENLTAPKPQQGVSIMHLHFWRPLPGLLIVDEHEAASGFPKETLLSNILMLTRQLSLDGASGERVRIPHSQELANLYSKDELGDELHAWLEAEVTNNGITELWVLGSTLASILMSRQEPAIKPFQRGRLNLLASVSPAVDVCILPSLTNILKEPSLKRALWHCLYQPTP